jgi:hypothetical protein
MYKDRQYKVHEGVDHILVTEEQETQRDLAWRLNFPEANGDKATEPTVVLEALQGSLRLAQIQIAWGNGGNNLAIRFTSQDTYASLELRDVESPFVSLKIDSPEESTHFLFDKKDNTLIGPQPITDLEVVTEVLGRFSEVTEALGEPGWLDDRLPPIEYSPVLTRRTGQRLRAIVKCKRNLRTCLALAVAVAVASAARAALVPVVGWAIVIFAAIGGGGGAAVAACQNTHDDCIENAMDLPL